MDMHYATFRTEVALEKNAEQAALTLINGIVALLEAAGSDLTKLAAVKTSLKENAAAFAEAVVTNTARATSALDETRTISEAGVGGQVLGEAPKTHNTP